MTSSPDALHPDDALGVEETRRRLPELLNRAQAGATTLISRHGRPVAALVPLGGRIPTDPMLRQRRLQALLNLQGSGKSCWPARPTPARPAPTPPGFVQSVSQAPAAVDPAAMQPAAEQAANEPAAARHSAPSRSRAVFGPQQLRQGDAIAFDGAALVAFLCDAKGTGLFLEPLLHGIGQGTWRGLISSLSLAEILQGPLNQGNEQLAQRYARVFAEPACWTVMPADAAVVEAAVRLQQSEPELSLTAAVELATAIAAGAAVLVSDNPLLAQTDQHPVLSALRR